VLSANLYVLNLHCACCAIVMPGRISIESFEIRFCPGARVCHAYTGHSVRPPPYHGRGRGKAMRGRCPAGNTGKPGPRLYPVPNTLGTDGRTAESTNDPLAVAANTPNETQSSNSHCGRGRPVTSRDAEMALPRSIEPA
jgi:hypothetical protein